MKTNRMCNFSRSRSITSLFSIGLLAGICFIVQGCSQPSSAGLGKNVLLISIDTCRADHVQPYSDDHAQTPTLKSIADAGIWFEDAVTPVPLTLPAHCSLLTGLHPMRHGVRNNYNYALSRQAVTLAELFLDSGYTSAGMIGSIIISRREGLSQGFDYFDDQFTQTEYEALQPTVERRAERVIASATGWLQDYLTQPSSGESPKPFFLFLHLYDPHMLYQPPSPFDTIYKDQPYDGEIAYTDACIGRLVAFLQEKSLYDNLILMVVGDHGEGLNDHKDPTHGLFLYEEAVHIPLLAKLPKNLRSTVGVPIRQGASLLDITPTLADLCGLGKVETDGISLVPWLLTDAPVQERNRVLETQYPMTYNWSPTYSLRNSQWKYIHAPIPELYNLVNDPHETQNLISAPDTPLLSMQAELENRLVTMAQSVILAERSSVSMDRAETLASLGYASGGSSTAIIAPDKPLPDPKEKLDVYLLVDRGLGYLARGFDHQSITLFEEAMQKDPNNPTPYVNLGLAYARVKQWDNAVEYTKKSVELSPENLLAQLQLSRFYVHLDRFEEGLALLQKIIKEFPQLAEAHYQLGELWMKHNDYSAALSEFELAKRWMPDMPGIDPLIEQMKKRPTP